MSKSEILSAAQALLSQDDRERAAKSQQLRQPNSKRAGIFLLSKAGLFRSRRTEVPAKTSALLEGLVLIAAALVAFAMFLLLLSRFRHG